MTLTTTYSLIDRVPNPVPESGYFTEAPTGHFPLAPKIESLVKDKVKVGNVTVIARSGLGVAVRKGAPKPDISSPQALRRTLLAAKSITYSDPANGGASGGHFAGVLERLGIATAIEPKTVLAKPGDEAAGLG